MIEYVVKWMATIESQYGVDPIVFGIIYCAGIVPFWFSLYKIIAGVQQKKFQQVRLFAVLLGITIISPFFYVALFGHNLPVWFWLVATCLIAYGVFSAVRKIKTVH